MGGCVGDEFVSGGRVAQSNGGGSGGGGGGGWFWLRFRGMVSRLMLEYCRTYS